MRRFVARSALFAALFVVTVGGICALEILAEIRAYRRELVLSDRASILVCNDSQTGAGIDPGEWPEVFNFSAHGRALDQAYLTVLDACDCNPPGKIRTVLFDVTPLAAVDTMAGPLRNMGYSAKYWLVHCLHRDETTRDLSDGFVVARDNLVGRRLRHYWRSVRGEQTFRSSLFGQFLSTDIVDKQLCPTRYWGLLKGKAASVERLSDVSIASPVFTSVLDRLADYARMRGVRLVLMTTPWNEDLRAACGAQALDRFTCAMQEFARRRGCVYLDFLCAEFDPSEWGDGNHLNHKGARKFTHQVRRELESRGVLK